jgi:hypothetical protein
VEPPLLEPLPEPPLELPEPLLAEPLLEPLPEPPLEPLLAVASLPAPASLLGLLVASPPPHPTP